MLVLQLAAWISKGSVLFVVYQKNSQCCLQGSCMDNHRGMWPVLLYASRGNSVIGLVSCKERPSTHMLHAHTYNFSQLYSRGKVCAVASVTGSIFHPGRQNQSQGKSTAEPRGKTRSISYSHMYMQAASPATVAAAVSTAVAACRQCLQPRLHAADSAAA